MSCLQPLCISTLLRRARALPSHAICHLVYVQTPDSGSPLKHHYQRLHMGLPVDCVCLSRCLNQRLDCYMVVYSASRLSNLCYTVHSYLTNDRVLRHTIWSHARTLRPCGPEVYSAMPSSNKGR